MNYPSLRSLVCVSMLLLSSPWSMAAEWRPISLRVGIEPSQLVYPLANFFDGAYLPYGEYILTDKVSGAYVGESKTAISFRSYFGAPPVVDVSQQKIDVSSIWAEGFTYMWGCTFDFSSCDPSNDTLAWRSMIGWNFGPTTPVDYVLNADGTFTATWIAPAAQNFHPGYVGQTIQFTFAAAVPEPNLASSFAVGLFVVAGWIGRGKRIVS